MTYCLRAIPKTYPDIRQICFKEFCFFNNCALFWHDAWKRSALCENNDIGTERIDKSINIDNEVIFQVLIVVVNGRGWGLNATYLVGHTPNEQVLLLAIQFSHTIHAAHCFEDSPVSENCMCAVLQKHNSCMQLPLSYFFYLFWPYLF